MKRRICRLCHKPTDRRLCSGCEKDQRHFDEDARLALEKLREQGWMPTPVETIRARHKFDSAERKTPTKFDSAE